VHYVDSEGKMIVPKSVRPIMDYKQTIPNYKREAIKQDRQGNLHIRKYHDRYAVHIDGFDPRKYPLSHLLIDAPECLIATAAAVSVGKLMSTGVYKMQKKEGKNDKSVFLDAARTGCVAGCFAGKALYTIASGLRKKEHLQ